MKFKSMLLAVSLTCLAGAAQAEDKHAHWAYTGHGGPAHWNELE